MLNSKQLIEKTRISRATLNNYVALGILPNPVVKTPGDNEGRATRLGYFEDDAVERIKLVQQMKKQGMTMAQIAMQLSEKRTSSVSTALPSSLGDKKLQTEVSSEGKSVV